MKKILAILCVALMIGCNGSNTKEPQTSLSTDPDSTFLPNGYDMTDIFKTRTGHITTTIDVNGKDITVDDLYDGYHLYQQRVQEESCQTG